MAPVAVLILKCSTTSGTMSPARLAVQAVPAKRSTSQKSLKTDIDAALAAGIFRREEVLLKAVKEHIPGKGIETK